jgi:hypothetical protein
MKGEQIAERLHARRRSLPGAAFEMPSLLERAGFKIRGTSRADCIHCDGRSSGTVAFTEAVAYCHRCKWTANVRTLARQLGLLATDPQSRRRFMMQDRERRRRERIAQKFELWRTSHLRRAVSEYRELGRNAEIAKMALTDSPTWYRAWDELKKFYDAEARLMQQIDYLSCTKGSAWLERNSRINELFNDWKQRECAA